MAGYEPARQPMTMMITNNDGNNQLIICGVISKSLPDIWLNRGNKAHAASTAIKAPIKVTTMDSVKNCAIRYLRGDPSTFLTPTSRARFDERAVDKFMKLTQAISNINMAIAEKMYT